MRTDTGRIGSVGLRGLPVLGVVLGVVPALGGCGDSADGKAAEVAGPASIAASAPSGSAEASDLPTTVAGSGSAAASGTPTPTASGAASGAAPPGPGASSSAPAGCRNATVDVAVKSAVVRTYGAAAKLPHAQPREGTFLYGRCGDTQYASAVFRPGAGSTDEEMINSQDEGSVRKYFTFVVGSGWKFAGSDAYPPKGGCATVIPAGLAQAWGNCT